ncbi:MAG: hypothetical protein H6594_05680 [Flavobacteriales bacterium]|nr:hypothetical protein [Flavobacteriales bacterium]
MLVPALQAFRPEVVVIYDDGFNYLTKMCLTVMRDAVLRMVVLAKQAGCHVAVNSSDASDHAGIYLEQGADAVVLGEGETSLHELVGHWAEGTPWKQVPGIAFREGEEVRATPKRPVLRDLDAPPAGVGPDRRGPLPGDLDAVERTLQPERGHHARLSVGATGAQNRSTGTATTAVHRNTWCGRSNCCMNASDRTTSGCAMTSSD